MKKKINAVTQYASDLKKCFQVYLNTLDAKGVWINYYTCMHNMYKTAIFQNLFIYPQNSVIHVYVYLPFL